MTTVLVTGATGFVGANLCRRLLEEGLEVHAMVRSSNNMWRLQAIADDLLLHSVDLLDSERLKTVIENINPDAVCHLGTYGGAPGQSDHKTIFDTNFYGTINLIEALSHTDCQTFINTGSSSEYGQKSLPMNESDLCEPCSAYGISKLSATLYCQMMAQKLSLVIGTLRIFSPYGPMEDIARLVASLFVSIHDNMPVQLGRPNAVRDFVYIDDVLDAYLCILKSPSAFNGQVLNVASHKETSVREMAELALEVSGQNVPLNFGSFAGRSQDTPHWCGNNRKIKDLYNWSPKTSLYDGLLASSCWYKEHLSLYKS